MSSFPKLPTILSKTEKDPVIKKGKRKPTTDDKSSEKSSDLAVATAMSLACFALGAVILAVSMPHLKQGAVRICRCSEWTGWLIAVVFDLSQILAEVAALVGPAMAVEVKVRRVARAVILCSTLVSMSLNVDAFIADAEPGIKSLVSGSIAGVLLPLGVLAFCYMGSTFWLARNVKSEKSLAKEST